MSEMITTIHGPRPKGLLRKAEGVDETETSSAHWVEYWDGEELVHRSVDILIKTGVEAKAAEGKIG